jgi:hypothetical protein
VSKQQQQNNKQVARRLDAPDLQKLEPGVKRMIAQMMEPTRPTITPTVTMKRVYPWCTQGFQSFTLPADTKCLFRAKPDLYQTANFTFYSNDVTTDFGLNIPKVSDLQVHRPGSMSIINDNIIVLPLDALVIPGMTSSVLPGAVGTLPVQVPNDTYTQSLTPDGRIINECLMTPLNSFDGVLTGDTLRIQMTGFIGKDYGHPGLEVGLLAHSTAGVHKYQFAYVSSTPAGGIYELSAMGPVNTNANTTFVKQALYLKVPELMTATDLTLSFQVATKYDYMGVKLHSLVNSTLSLAHFGGEDWDTVKNSATQYKFSHLSCVLTNTTSEINKGGNLTAANAPLGVFPETYDYDQALTALTKMPDFTNTKMSLKKGGHIYYLPQTFEELEFRPIEPPGSHYRQAEDKADLCFFMEATLDQTLKITVNWNVEFITRSSVVKGDVTGPHLLRLKQLIIAYAVHTFRDTIHDDNPTHREAIKRRVMALVKHPLVRKAMKDVAKYGLTAAMSALAL